MSCFDSRLIMLRTKYCFPWRLFHHWIESLSVQLFLWSPRSLKILMPFWPVCNGLRLGCFQNAQSDLHTPFVEWACLKVEISYRALTFVEPILRYRLWTFLWIFMCFSFDSFFGQNQAIPNRVYRSVHKIGFLFCLNYTLTPWIECIF